MKLLKNTLTLITVLLVLLLLFSCAGAGYDGDGSYGGAMMDAAGDSAPRDPSGTESDGAEPDDGEGAPEDNGQSVTLPAGMITAGAWCDNDSYSYWLEQFMQGESGGKFQSFNWGFNSQRRVKVSVKAGDSPVAGATVVASDEEGNALFSAVTDAKGNAYLFPSDESGTVTVTSGEYSATAEFTADNRALDISLDGAGVKLNTIEIMLVVDVTGSMGDEISFLKAELADVINRIAANDERATIKLAMLFYRDTDDAVPFDYYDFTDVTAPEGMARQQAELDKQYASGGGDYPEAVDEALELAVSKQWSTGATTKIIFQVLDAPAHNGQKYKDKLVSATEAAAEKGIRICPIICSGASEDTEYTMREAAIYTGGTFIFVTDDSGIGGAHHDPNLPNVTVELLNSLMVRLVNGYHTGEFAPAVYWKDDPNLATQ